MLSTDREEFEVQLAMLCAGYDKPVGERVEAYWKGCGKMSLIEFARCVEYALGSEGPEKLPPTQAMWGILKKLRTETRSSTYTQPEDTRDHIEYYANRLLLRHMGNRLGLGSTGKFISGYGLVGCVASPELLACRQATRALVNWFLEPIREGAEDATPAQFIELFIRAIAAVSTITPATLTEWNEQIKDPAAQHPFPTWMARPLARTSSKPQLILA